MSARSGKASAPRTWQEYHAAGLEPIPNSENTKHPMRKGWQSAPIAEQWRGAPAGCNIGIRCGENIIALDCDDWAENGAGTTAHVLAHLKERAGLELGDFPHTSTPGGGTRCILRIEPGDYYALKGYSGNGNAVHFAPAIGAGHIAFGPGSQVLVPPSTIDGKPYTMLAGDWAHVPVVRARDLFGLIGDPRESTPAPEIASAAAALVLPQKTFEHLQGEGLDYHGDRSTKEAATVLELVNKGATFEQVLAAFIQYGAYGKFAERYERNQRAGIKYLWGLYTSAQKYGASHESPGRRRALDCAQWARENHGQWAGRGGASQRAVYLALCELGARAGRVDFAAAQIDLANLANMHQRTVGRVLQALRSAGLIRLTMPHLDKHPRYAARYEIITQTPALARRALPPVAHPITEIGQTNTESTTGGAREMSNSLTPPNGGGIRHVARQLGDSRHDAFLPQALGRGAGLVWDALREHGAMTAREIAGKTGRHVGDVRRALARMAGKPWTVRRTARRLEKQQSKATWETSERDITRQLARAIVDVDPGGLWCALPDVDLNDVARELGTLGTGQRRTAMYAKQRADYARELEAIERHAPAPVADLQPVDVDRQAGPVARRQSGAPAQDESTGQGEKRKRSRAASERKARGT